MIAAPPPSGPTTIVSHVSVPVHGKITGTFTATGAIADDGTLVDTFKVLGHEGGATKTRVQRWLYGRKGTIHFEFVLLLRGERATGTWRVVSGAQAYAKLAGHGSYAGLVRALPHGAERIRDTMRGTVGPAP